MAIKKWIFIFFLPLLILSVGSRGEAQTFTGIKNWRYLPLDEAFWSQSEDAIKNQNWENLNTLIESQIKKNPGNSKTGEALAAILMACDQLKILSCVYTQGMHILNDYPGSNPALLALTKIEELIRNQELYEMSFSRQINLGSFREVPESLLGFLNYFSLKHNLEHGLPHWTNFYIQKLNAEEFWGQKFKYESLLEQVRREPALQMLPKLELFYKDLEESHPLHSKLALQIARLRYETLDYQEAARYYSRVTPRFREQSRILRERAWTAYWLRDFAETLGLVHTLKAPHYAVEFEPETYLLEMVTLRSLCHYPTMRQTYQEFNRRFGQTIRHIQIQRSFTNDPVLAQMAMQNRKHQKLTLLIHNLRQDQQSLESNSQLPPELKKRMSQNLISFETYYRELAEFEFKAALEQSARSLIELYEQMQLLDYLAGIDQNSFSRGYEQRTYSATPIPKSDFGTLFWPVKSEYWIDEIKNYRVLVNDQCEGGGL